MITFGSSESKYAISTTTFIKLRFKVESDPEQGALAFAVFAKAVKMIGYKLRAPFLHPGSLGSYTC